MKPESNDPLDALLAADGDEEMRPGFDTRFHARLAEHKARAPKSHWWVLLVLPASIAAAIVLTLTVMNKPRGDDAAAAIEIAYEYELYEDYDVVRDLPDLEVLEMLAAADMPQGEGVPQ